MWSPNREIVESKIGLRCKNQCRHTLNNQYSVHSPENTTAMQIRSSTLSCCIGIRQEQTTTVHQSLLTLSLRQIVSKQEPQLNPQVFENSKHDETIMVTAVLCYQILLSNYNSMQAYCQCPDFTTCCAIMNVACCVLVA